MDDTPEEDIVLDLPILDATDLVVGEIILDDENYDEVIVLDLRVRDRHDHGLV